MSGFPRAPVVFLVDVDNTLLDNDLVSADLLRHLDLAMGPEGRARYWALFEQLGAGLGYVDYLCALQRYRLEHPRHAPPDRVRLPGGLPVREPGLSGIARRRGVPAPQGGALRSGPLVDDKLRVLTVVKRSWGPA